MSLYLIGYPELERESSDGSSTMDEDGHEKPLVARQTSLKELPCTSRKSCEAIPEESKDADGCKSDDPNDLQPLPRERVYTMPALNVQRRSHPDTTTTPRRSLLSLDSTPKDTNSTSGTNPR